MSKPTKIPSPHKAHVHRSPSVPSLVLDNRAGGGSGTSSPTTPSFVPAGSAGASLLGTSIGATAATAAGGSPVVIYGLHNNHSSSRSILAPPGTSLGFSARALPFGSPAPASVAASAASASAQPITATTAVAVAVTSAPKQSVVGFAPQPVRPFVAAAPTDIILPGSAGGGSGGDASGDESEAELTAQIRALQLKLERKQQASANAAAATAARRVPAAIAIPVTASAPSAGAAAASTGAENSLIRSSIIATQQQQKELKADRLRRSITDATTGTGSSGVATGSKSTSATPALAGTPTTTDLSSPAGFTPPPQLTASGSTPPIIGAKQSTPPSAVPVPPASAASAASAHPHPHSHPPLPIAVGGSGRLLIVANRLPVSLHVRSKQNYSLHPALSTSQAAQYQQLQLQLQMQQLQQQQSQSQTPNGASPVPAGTSAAPPFVAHHEETYNHSFSHHQPRALLMAGGGAASTTATPPAVVPATPTPTALHASASNASLSSGSGSGSSSASKYQWFSGDRNGGLYASSASLSSTSIGSLSTPVASLSALPPPAAVTSNRSSGSVTSPPDDASHHQSMPSSAGTPAAAASSNRAAPPPPLLVPAGRISLLPPISTFSAPSPGAQHSTPSSVDDSHTANPLLDLTNNPRLNSSRVLFAGPATGASAGSSGGLMSPAASGLPPASTIPHPVGPAGLPTARVSVDIVPLTPAVLTETEHGLNGRRFSGGTASVLTNSAAGSEPLSPPADSHSLSPPVNPRYLSSGSAYSLSRDRFASPEPSPLVPTRRAMTNTDTTPSGVKPPDSGYVTVASIVAAAAPPVPPRVAAAATVGGSTTTSQVDELLQNANQFTINPSNANLLLLGTTNPASDSVPLTPMNATITGPVSAAASNRNQAASGAAVYHANNHPSTALPRTSFFSSNESSVYGSSALASPHAQSGGSAGGSGTTQLASMFVPVSEAEAAANSNEAETPRASVVRPNAISALLAASKAIQSASSTTSANATVVSAAPVTAPAAKPAAAHPRGPLSRQSSAHELHHHTSAHVTVGPPSPALPFTNPPPLAVVADVASLSSLALPTAAPGSGGGLHLLPVSGGGDLPPPVSSHYHSGGTPSTHGRRNSLPDGGSGSRKLPAGSDTDPDSNWSFQMSSGGLVSTLQCLDGLNSLWIGWAGAPIAESADLALIKQKMRHYSCVPVFLEPAISDLYYHGFSNTVLWPLFHYVQPAIEVIQSADDQWQAYEAVNRQFADVVLSEYRDGDIVWLHDYHLMLLPAMLRQAKPSMKVGFFLHCPFPSSELYRTLPWREELLHGVLSADLIGFHTHDYARHFRSACTRILGLQCNPEGVSLGDSTALVAAHPIGINPDRWIRALSTAPVKQHIADLEHKFRGKRIILGIDRLDNTKGLPHKLYAIERMFAKCPEFIGKVVLLQIAVPTKVDEAENALSRTVHELVGRINGKYGTIYEVPIHFLDTSVSFDRLCALYRVADVCVCASTRDGMNLVSYEYVCCQGNDKAGVLILSEFTGAAQSLGAGALRVNPWDVAELADSYQTALNMDLVERRAHQQFAFQYVLGHTAQHWAYSFLSTLSSAAPKERGLIGVPPKLDFEVVRSAFMKSSHRLIICGLIGTLTAKRVPKTNPLAQRLAAHATPNMILPTPDAPQHHLNSKSTPHNRNGSGSGSGSGAHSGHHHHHHHHHTGSSGSGVTTHVYTKTSGTVQNSLRQLAADPNTTVVVLTSRGRDLCESLLGDSSSAGIWIAAENGYYLRRGGTSDPSTRQWLTMFDNVDMSWMAEVRSVFQYFTERTPKSFIEDRETYLSWHYRDCEEEFGESQAHDLMTHLVSGPLANTSTQVINHSRIVQVRPTGVSKGFIAERIVTELEKKRGALDFILCLGNFLQHDEDLFTVLTDPELSPFSKPVAPSPLAATTTAADGKDQKSGATGAQPQVSAATPAAAPAAAASGGSRSSLPERTVFTVTVGKKQSRAIACIPTVNESEKLFQQLALSLPTPTPTAAAAAAAGHLPSASPRAGTRTTATPQLQLGAWADSRTIY